MAIRMVALDLDGTTLNSAGELTDHTMDVLERAGDKGVHIVVSTGRPYGSLPEAVKNVKAIKYAITSNGAHINMAATGEAIYSNYLAVSAVERAAEVAGELDVEIEIFIGGRAYMARSYYEHIRDYGVPYRRAEYVLWSRKPVEDIIGMLLDNRDRIENINFCFPTIEYLNECRPIIESIPESTATSSFANCLELGGPTTSKKTALIELMGMLGVDREELMCCGDAPNDIEMIDFAGLGVAVGNAWGGTAEHADYIAPTNDEDGVAEAITRFVLQN